MNYDEYIVQKLPLLFLFLLSDKEASPLNLPFLIEMKKKAIIKSG